MSSEADAIARTDEPLSVERLVADLRALGVTAGDAVLVHSSLSSLGWVSGGAPAVVDALMEAVTEDGTLVMPTHTGHYSDPEGWEDPPIPESWATDVRTSMPPYRPEITPTRGMGAIPECFRTYPGVVRSRHPTNSFAAWGADAEFVVGDHDYDHGLGERSPLARLNDLDGSVLLLGASHGANTSLHLAEHRADYEKTTVTQDAPVLGGDGHREWTSFEELDYDSSDFEKAGEAFERDRPDAVARGRVGEAETVLLSQRALVDYGTEWLAANRT